jgi:hypothetical protein
MSKKIKIRIAIFLMSVSIGTVHAALPSTFKVGAKKFTYHRDSLLPAISEKQAVGKIGAAAELKIDTSYNRIDTRYKTAVDRIYQKATDLEAYIKANNYNAEYCFLIDMSVPSGKKRFFVYNLKNHTIEQSALVTHGIGSNKKDNAEELQFSNLPSSLQTSLGKYRVGSSYYGNFGLAFKLYGLDKTNDKAYERAIVLHSHSAVPLSETYPDRISESFGCPTVAPSFLNTLTTYINGSQKPILMWIYN